MVVGRRDDGFVFVFVFVSSRMRFGGDKAMS